ncbi:hypothetical protein V6N12_062432 [Hibiscus sabdariffa]|uniref:Uncharacterized protein n=1 Tax=Hibiscus sabdariffa TaxID=183260 RepID=A0ABR2F8Z5_9ROSI
MEADDGADSTLHDDKNDQPVVDATTKGEDVCGAGKVSYADMVVSSTKSSMGDALATKFVEEEVVILDEDVQMDTLEPIPSISFFDKGKEVAKKVEDNNQGVELYGSWMMVGTHRRRFAAKSAKVKWMVNVGIDGIHQ